MSNPPHRAVVVGVAGRMGRCITELAAGRDDLLVVGGVERADSPAVGGGLSELGLPGDGPVVTRLEEAPACDVVIDFSLAFAAAAVARAAGERGDALVVGSTGLDAAAMEALEEAARSVPVLFSPNMSIGVNLLFDLVRAAAAALGKGWDVEVLEAHHRNKVDAPSGTAARLVDILSASSTEPRDDLVYGREGRTGVRGDGEIGVHAIRGGDVVGEHVVTFFGPGERVELVHRAHDRAIFAHGALHAAAWLAGREAALYSMADVLR
jgi:4-hydroxy-tetrahydrodipicolinate reductase